MNLNFFKKGAGTGVMKGIKKWSLLLLLILLVSCSNDQPPLSPEQAGREVIELLQSGDYQSIYDEWFDEQLQAELSIEEIQETWVKRTENGGEFVALHPIVATNRGQNLDVIEAKVEYTSIVFEVRMIFNESRQLVGFSLSEGTANASLPEDIVEEEIIVGEGTDFELTGTLTMPKEAEEKLPAVVLVHGSGPSDRDEAVYAYKPFRDLAWGLAQQGIAVIRYDKRTYIHGEKMAQDATKLTVYEETVEDAIRATELVMGDDRIDENQVHIIGHSLGGMLAPRIDAQGGDYRGLIILAGSPRPLWEIVYDQNLYLLEKLDEATKKEQEKLVEAEYEKAQQLEDMSDEEAWQLNVFGMNGYYLKEMDQFDVPSMTKKLEKPILILQGEDDFQVYYEKDFMLWKDLLEDHTNATFISYPNLNHFFIKYEGPGKGTVAEYETPNQVSAEVIQDIGRWILEQKESS